MLYDNRKVKLNDGRSATLVLPNWFGFKHKKVAEKFEGDLEYMASLSIKGWVYAVYKAHKPNLQKGHKDFVLMWVETASGNPKTFIAGMAAAEMDEHRYQNGRLCRSCNEIVYSVDVHDYRHCSCETVMIDGGKDYTRCSQEGESVRIDFLTKEITV